MKLSVAAVFLAFVSATSAISAGQAGVFEPESVDSRSFDFDLEDRSALACTSSPKCKCNKVQGQFCGLGYSAGGTVYCKVGNVYECNKDTGNTCTYGPRASCKECNKLKC